MSLSQSLYNKYGFCYCKVINPCINIKKKDYTLQLARHEHLPEGFVIAYGKMAKNDAVTIYNNKLKKYDMWLLDDVELCLLDDDMLEFAGINEDTVIEWRKKCQN